MEKKEADHQTPLATQRRKKYSRTMLAHKEKKNRIMKKIKDIVFSCQKCGHLQFVDFNVKGIRKMIKLECPECGEEPCWILEREGDYEKEYG